MHPPLLLLPQLRLATLASLLGVALALCVTAGRPAHAAIDVSLEPDAAQIDPLGAVNVTVAITGLGDGVAPSLGVFELDVSFDETRLSLGTPAYGDPQLGDQLGLQETPTTETQTDTPGLANLFELSLDSAPALDSGQAPAFALVVLPFTAVGHGSAPIDLSIATLGDANGDPLTATAHGTTVQIPEPRAAALAGTLAVAALGLVRRRRNALAALAAASLLAAPAIRAESALPGDVNHDGKVDRADLAIVAADRGRSVADSRCGADCDLDGDGTITALDARLLVSLCAATGCGADATTGGSGQ